MTTFCPSCGTERREGAAFCAGCGHQYPVVATPPTTRGTVAPPPTDLFVGPDAGDTIRASSVRFACGACGATNTAGARFCLACGAEFQDDGPTTVAVAGAPPPRRREPIVAGIVVALVLVGGGAWWLATSGGEKDPDLEELVTVDGTADLTPAPETLATPDASAGTAVVTAVPSTPATTTATTVAAATVAAATPVPATTPATVVAVATTVTPVTPLVTNAPPPVATPAPAPVVTNPPPVTTVPGDLGIPGRAMSRPACDRQFITMVGSTTDPAAWVRNVTDLLATYPGASYLRTDQTCPSLRPDVDGNAIYSVYFGPFASRQAACDARSQGSADAYVKQLANDLDPLHRVDC